jgi:hypothetical protein
VLTSTFATKRSLVLAVTSAVVLGLAACGDSDEDASGGAGGGAPAETATTATETTAEDTGKDEKRDVARIVEGLYRDLAGGNAAAVCGAMSETARERIAQQTLGGSTDAPQDRTCAKSMTRFLEAAAGSGVLERTLGATVEKVTVAGRTATATVSFGGASGEVALRKEDGSWRFGADAIAPSGR